MKQLMKFVKISSLLFFVGCAGAPTKPNPELCINMVTFGYADCALVNGRDFKKAKDLTYDEINLIVETAQNRTNKPLSYLDKAVCFTPPNWEMVQNYISALEDYAQNQCRENKASVSSGRESQNE